MCIRPGAPPVSSSDLQGFRCLGAGFRGSVKGSCQGSFEGSCKGTVSADQREGTLI